MRQAQVPHLDRERGPTRSDHLRRGLAIAAAALFVVASLARGQENHPLRIRALTALNAFEAWAFMHRPPESIETANRHIRCESGANSTTCYPGTILPCMGCVGGSVTANSAVLSREQFAVAERLMLATLDSAANLFPRDELLVGLRVYMLSKRGRHSDAARAAERPRCGLAEAQCLLLQGFVAQRSGRYVQAQALLDSALRILPDSARCALEDTSPLHDYANRRAYAQMPCDAARAARDSVFWWLADPSYLIPGNDRRTEHLARGVGNRVLALYRGAATSMDGVIWFAGAVPQADSIGRFADHEAEFARTLGPWRWHRELTRFGMPDSFESLPDVDISAGWSIREGRGRGATTGTPNPTARSTIRAGARFFADCPRGFEPRELLITDLRPDLGVRPREGAANAGLYPPVVFTGYRWARPLWINCVRAYNSTALYQFTPEWPLTRHVLDTAVIIGIGAEGLNGGLPYREQYSPPYGPVSEIRRFQLARFPRGDSMLLVGTVAPSGRIARTVVPHPKRGPWRVGLIAASVVAPKSTREVTIAEIRPDSLVSRYQLSVALPTRSILAGFEILTPDTAGLARMRTTLPLSPWLTGATRISDLLLLSLPGGANLPRGVTLDSLLQFVMASTVINAGQNLGLYWEIQLGEGAPPGVDLDMTLSVERTERTSGGLGAFLRSLFGRGRGTQLTTWKDSPAERGTAPGSRITGAVNVATAQLEPGEYRLTLRAALSGAAPVLSMREFSILKAGAQPM